MQSWSIATGKTSAQTTDAVPGSIAPFLDRRAQTTSVPPGAEAFTAGPVDIPATATAAAVRTTVRVPVPADVTATAPDAEALTAKLLVCGEPECENQPCLEYGSKTRLKPLLSPPMLSHPDGIPPWVVNNPKSQTTTHFITGGTVYTTPPRYTTPGAKIPKPKILSPGVCIPCHIRYLCWHTCTINSTWYTSWRVGITSFQWQRGGTRDGADRVDGLHE